MVGDDIGDEISLTHNGDSTSAYRCSTHIDMAIGGTTNIHFFPRNANHTTTQVEPSSMFGCWNEHRRALCPCYLRRSLLLVANGVIPFCRPHHRSCALLNRPLPVRLLISPHAPGAPSFQFWAALPPPTSSLSSPSPLHNEPPPSYPPRPLQLPPSFLTLTCIFRAARRKKNGFGLPLLGLPL